MLRVGAIADDTEAEGPGRRFALWVQGCSLRCPGCCNPELFADRAATPMALDDVLARIAASTAIEGISLLGGEPTEQADDVAALAQAARARGLTVMLYSGYTLAELQERGPAVAALLAATDLLVDGRYDQTQPEPAPPVGRRWIGSANQQLHFLSAAYSVDDPQFRGANTVEVHVRNGRVLVNGWPAGAAALLGRRR